MRHLRFHFKYTPGGAAFHSRLGEPIDDRKPWDPAELADVMGHQRGAETEGVGADLGVEGIDRHPGLFEGGPDGSVDLRGRLVEIGDFEGQQEFVEGPPVPWE